MLIWSGAALPRMRLVALSAAIDEADPMSLEILGVERQLVIPLDDV